MKKLNAVSDFSQHRALFLQQAFRTALAGQARLERMRLFEITASAPAPRFWVSEARAAYVVGQQLLGNDPLRGMFPEKREMYREILKRFFIMRRAHPAESITSLVTEIVNSPAPRSYLSPTRVESIICHEKRRRRKEVTR